MERWQDVGITTLSQGQWEVLAVRKRVLGDKHPQTLELVDKLSSIYRSRCHWTEAEELCVQVLAARRKILGEEHTKRLEFRAALHRYIISRSAGEPRVYSRGCWIQEGYSRQ